MLAVGLVMPPALLLNGKWLAPLLYLFLFYGLRVLEFQLLRDRMMAWLSLSSVALSLLCGVQYYFGPLHNGLIIGAAIVYFIGAGAAISYRAYCDYKAGLFRTD
jgi:hypothetical protein